MKNEKKLSIRDIDIITKEVLKSAIIEDSSDFVRVAHDINAVTYPQVAERISDILCIEEANDGKDWAENACNAQVMMNGMTLAEAKTTRDSYKTVLDFFLLDKTSSAIYRMDETDHTGWRIWRELDAKYLYAKKLVERLQYRHDKGYA